MLQRKLAAIRADLDSFTEVEAYSLMLHGYLMTERELIELDKQHKRDGEPGTWGGFDVKAPRGNWPFRKLEGLIKEPYHSRDPRRADLRKQLEVGSAPAFKIWMSSPLLRGLFRVGAIAAIALVAWWFVQHWNHEVFRSITVRGSTMFFAALVAGIIFRKAIIAVAGFVVTNIHVLVFDRIFLSRGKLDRLLKLK